MSDAEADKYVESSLASIIQFDTLLEARRELRLLVKEVERDTRHKCCELVGQLSVKIMNIDHSVT